MKCSKNEPGSRRAAGHHMNPPVVTMEHHQQAGQEHDLLIWDLDDKDCEPAGAVMIKHGCTGPLEIQASDDVLWCAASFSSWDAADACAAAFERGFPHLRVRKGPGWQTFGNCKATVKVELIHLAERLGCRQNTRMLSRFEAVWLARGAAHVLAAVELAGGVQTLSAADPAAAACLCRDIMLAVYIQGRCWLPRDLPDRVERAFAVLGPSILPAAAASVREAEPGSPQHACIAIRLTEGFLLSSEGKDQATGQDAAASGKQKIASDCFGLLHATADALSAWLKNVSKAVQQQRQQQAGSKQLLDEGTALQLRETGTWLLGAACDVLKCMRQHELCSMVDERQQLTTVGQLVHRVVTCVQLEERASAAGLWPPNITLGIAPPQCADSMHLTLVHLRATMDKAAYCAGLPAVRAATSKALCTAVEHLASPQHIELLLHLSITASWIMTDGPCPWKTMGALMSPLARLQPLATSWLSDEANLQDAPSVSMTEGLPLERAPVEELPFAHQVALLLDINATHLAAAVKCVLSSCQEDCTTNDDIIFESGAVSALAAALQAVPASKYRNMRIWCSSLVLHETNNCLAPGLYLAANILAATQSAASAALVGKPWAADAVVALLRSALGSVRMAHAESAAQAALNPTARTVMRPNPQSPYNMRCDAANILAGVYQGLTPLIAHALVQHGMVAPLLQALPWQATSSELAADESTWKVTTLGTGTIGQILQAVLTADQPTRISVQRNGSWDAAVQRVRDLQPPPSLGPEWIDRWKEVLLCVEGAIGGGVRRRRHTTSCGTAAAPADADAIAAAERAMQELLAEEQPDDPSSSSKAAAKRARKKAARQRVVTADPSAQPMDMSLYRTAQLTNEAAQPTAGAGPADQAANSSHSSMPAATAPQPETAEAMQATAGISSSGAANTSRSSTPAAASPQPDADKAVQAAAGASRSSTTNMPLQQTGISPDHPVPEADWWRCPLSGRVMRDPVLCGSEGHSFERAALEQWLATNPGVHPLSRQPLPPEADAMLPNHALRNLIQQLQLG